MLSCPAHQVSSSLTHQRVHPSCPHIDHLGVPPALFQPGFGLRFLPKDHEVILWYLNKKIERPTEYAVWFLPVITDLYQHHPQYILQRAAKDDIYFFCESANTYHVSRTVSDLGTYKMDGRGPVFAENTQEVIGEKTHLNFRVKGTDKSSKWVIKRVHKQEAALHHHQQQNLDSMPPLRKQDKKVLVLSLMCNDDC